MKKFERQAQSQRKHGPLPVSSASKAPVPPPRNRPEWSGPGYVKKATRKHQASPAAKGPTMTFQDQLLPVALHQAVLDIIRDTFPAALDYAALKPVLSRINDALLQRDFETAFGTHEFREGYAIRWSPSRALAYSNLMAQICDQRAENPWVRRMTSLEHETTAKVLCFGRCAAEVVGLAGFLRYAQKNSAGRPDSTLSSQHGEAPEVVCDQMGLLPQVPYMDIHLVDAVDWSEVISKLHAGLTKPPTLTKYASAAARAANAGFLSPQALQTSVTKADVFTLTMDDLNCLTGPGPVLCTLLFTLNDLYTLSIRDTTSFLRRLTSSVPRGSLLLVVDHPEAACSPGITPEGGDKKQYPMSWLLDKALLPTQEAQDVDGNKQQHAWEKIIDDANKIYKLPEKRLTYPVGLENLKMQVHLFERL